MEAEASVAIIGGGFYGCRIAIALAEMGIDKVVVLERENGIMRRASFVNQARIHNGYHYPRAQQTATSARANFLRFVIEYQSAVLADVQMVYAIARHSRVSADQFVRFCDHIGAEWKPVSHRWVRLFEPALVEAVFSVTELAFDAKKIARDVAGRMARAGVTCRFGVEARIEKTSERDVTIGTTDGPLVAKHVVNCTYVALADIGIPIDHAIKKELAEIALVRPPDALEGLAVTIMDGPFFSCMPFPALDCYSLSHVRYTPHVAWHQSLNERVSVRSRAELMRRDAERFMPCLRDAEYLGSLYDVKAVLSRAERNDARPIIFETSSRSDRVISVLGSKMDNIYDIEALLRRHVWNM